MPIDKYSVLRGRPIDTKVDDPATDDKPHYHVQLQADGTFHEASINILSKLPPSDLKYIELDPFNHALVNKLSALPAGFTRLPRVANASNPLSLDYVRDKLFDPTKMKLLEAFKPGPNNDLHELLDGHVTDAMHDNGEMFIWGSRWLKTTKTNSIFRRRFKPDSGVHDVHMNQGNAAEFAHTDSVDQDGGLVFHFPSTNRWVAIFLAFQSQCWQTDRNGKSLCP